MVMMPLGTELTAALIERLGHAGIDTIVVVGGAAATQGSPDDVRRAFDELFAGHEHDAWMMDLKGIVVRQALRGDHDA